MFEEPAKVSAHQIKLLTGLLIIVSILIFAAHWPAISAKALSFDDYEYLTNNSLVQHPGWASAGRFLTEILEPSTVRGYYQPLTMISLMVDYAMGGRENHLKPFHITSLVLHTLNSCLIIVLLYMLFGNVWAAAGVGLLFAVHPMTVEPIPWVGERKTLLAAFFTLWCLICYVRFARSKGGWKLYTGCIVLYVLALMSKPTSMPVPALLLLMDYWPLRRLKWRSVVEKIPFFSIGVIFAAITYISQSRTCGVQLPSAYGPQRIPLIVCHNIIFYLYKIIWPSNLSSHYAFPKPFGLSDHTVLAGVIGSAVLIPLLVISLRWTRGAFAGWLFFFAAILPTMQLIGFSNVIASDKFAYLPSVGILMALACFAGWFLDKTIAGKAAVGRVLMIAVMLALVSAEAIATRHYLAHWRDTVSLYEYMLTLTPDAPSLHFNLAYGLESSDDDKAVFHYRRTLELDANDFSAHNNLACLLEKQGKIEEAIQHYEQALKLNPSHTYSHNNLGALLRSQGKMDLAMGHFYQALKAKPDFAPAHKNIADTLFMQGRFDEAMFHYREVIRIAPDYAVTYNNLGLIMQIQGRFDEAISYHRKSLQLEPEVAITHKLLGNALAAKGEIEEALSNYQQALRLDPNYVEPMDQMARILCTHPDQKLRDVKKAIELAERAAVLTEYKDAKVLDTLAAAYAAAGRFEQAIETTQKALELASAGQDVLLTEHIRSQLESYKQAKR